MDLNSVQAPVDEWDADGFEIPCLNLGKPGTADTGRETKGIKESKSSSQQGECSFRKFSDVPTDWMVSTLEEKIYLGPHGAPPSVVKQQELHAAGKKQRLKQKLKEADRKSNIGGPENKVENLRQLIGGKGSKMSPRSSPREWLDPHCHESQFERYN